MFAAQMIITSFIIYMATFFQHVLGYGPLLASLALAPAVVTQPVFSVLTGRLTDRIGARAPALFGYLLAAVALAWLALFVDNDSYALLLPGLLLLGPSIAPMFTSLLTDLSNEVAAEERGDANALVLTVRWIGAAAGTMILGVVIHAGEGSVPGPGPYATAFAILAAAALAGAAGLLRSCCDRRPSSDEARWSSPTPTSAPGPGGTCCARRSSWSGWRRRWRASTS